MATKTDERFAQVQSDRGTSGAERLPRGTSGAERSDGRRSGTELLRETISARRITLVLLGVVFLLVLTTVLAVVRTSYRPNRGC